MKQLLTILLTALFLLLGACQQVELPMEEAAPQGGVTGPEFTALVEAFGAGEHDGEGALTKTALANGSSVVWSAGDQIAIFQGTEAADTYQVDEKCVGTTQGRFGVVAKGESSVGEGFDANIAIYPYQDGLAVTPVVEDGQPTAYQITGVTIPSVQTYTANTFSNCSFLMAAVTDGLTDHTLSFKNLCGTLKLQLKGTCKVKTICLQGNDGEPLSGDATITICQNGSVPILAMSENASAMVSVNWIDGVQLNTETATSFFITVPPTSFEKGFTVKIVDIMGAEAVIQTSKANAVVRSYVHTMPEITIETVYPSVDVNTLSGLSIACIGDSITQGVGAESTPYPSQLATRLNATVKNLGVSGSSLCEGGARTCNIGQLTEANCAGKDIVTILMGVNDWAAARNNASEGVYYHLGDINTRETNTIRGAMRMWCDKIQELRNTESCANTRFYFMTPTITSWNSSVTKTRDWDQSKTNIHGFTLRDLCHAIIDVASEYDIPVIDLNLCSGIYYNSPEDENASLYGGDGVHINGAGHTLVTDAIIRALASDMENEVDLFVFAGQSNMMGAAHLPPVDNPITYDSFEYKYQNVLKGGKKGEFVYAQNPAGDWHYMDTDTAYGEQYLDAASGKSKQANYSSTMYFIPACRDQEKGFSGQSEYQNYPSATMAPYFAQYYSELGRKCVYAHMAKGSCKIVHYFTESAMDEYNRLITEYNSANSTSYATLTSSSLSGAGDAFDAKYKAMLKDYAAFAPENTIINKCFVWLQGEGDTHKYAEYKLKLQALWSHLQSLGFTHFFILRVGYWGSTSVINEIRAQEDFCEENENCYIVSRAPSLIPHPSATVNNWWISEPSEEYADCRDSYLASTSNHHFNEKAHKIFARRSAENINRVLHLGLEPILEDENIKGME